MFAFTPLLGAHSASQAVQSLLEFDNGVKVLIDVGWDTAFDAESLKELERQVTTISVILLTHPTLAHIGAYAHCCKHVPQFSRIPVYATAPVISLGRTLLQDLYASNPLAASVLPASSVADASAASSDLPQILLQRPSNDEIASYFTVINPLKYSQPHQPLAAAASPPLDGLTVTAYASGHTLGGTIWHLQHASESVVYAVDWNHARENLLSGAAWLSTGGRGAEVIEQLRNPSALICSSKGAETESLAGGWRKRDDLLLSHVRATVARGASVLIPCDTSARCLELAYLLERSYLKDSASFRGAVPYLVSRTCSATIRYARSMLEWMDESVAREFEALSSARPGANGQREGVGLEPFNLEHVRLLDHAGQLSRALASDGPKVILANDATLEWGFSRDVLARLGNDENNLVILTEGSSGASSSLEGDSKALKDHVTTSRLLSQLLSSRGTPDEPVQCAGNEIEVKSYETAPLAANDQQYYQQWLASQRERQQAVPSEQLSSIEASADVADNVSESTSSSEGESDDEHQGKVLNVSNAMTHSKHKLGLTDEELGINILLRRKNVHDYDVRGKRGREKVFPFVVKRQRRDEYGDVIRPEEYLRAEEKEDMEDLAARVDGAKIDSAAGEKRRWDGRGKPRADAQSKLADGHAKSRHHKDGDEHDQTRPDGQAKDADAEESDYEPDEPVMLGPMKVLFKTETLSLRLRIAAVDYSSIHDKRSLRMLIPLIAPRKIILTGGRSDETTYLAEECRRMLSSSESSGQSGADVFAPHNGTVVEASVDTNSWTIRLSRPLYKSLRWQTFRGLGIVTVNGQLEATAPQEGADAAADGAAKRQKLDAGNTEKAKSLDAASLPPPTLDLLPAALGGTSRTSSQSLHVGDLRLAELRRLLLATGHIAEFKGEGTLLVDGVVAVRKNAVGHIEVESGRADRAGRRGERAGPTFFDVKRKIYEGLAVVAAR